MAILDADADALKSYCAAVATCAVGGVDYVLLTALRLAGCTPNQTDALLCLGERGEGYATRLFFAQVVAPPKPFTLNWNSNNVRILERVWFAYSWKVPMGLSPEQTLIEHLKPLR
jgi:hypothetical protein